MTDREIDIGTPPSCKFRAGSAERAQGPHILCDRPHLDATPFRTRNPRCDLDCFVQVSGLDKIVAAELLLGLGERNFRVRVNWGLIQFGGRIHVHIKDH